MGNKPLKRAKKHAKKRTDPYEEIDLAISSNLSYLQRSNQDSSMSEVQATEFGIELNATTETINRLLLTPSALTSLVLFIALTEMMQLQVLSTRFYAEVMPSLESKIKLPYPVWHG